MKKILKLLIIFLYLFTFNLIVNASELPKLYITGDISNITDKEDVRSVEIRYESQSLNFECYATFKLQGQYSVNYPKKNYNIKLFKDSDNSQKEYIDFKWGAFHKYTLKANWTDNTHSRNIVASDIAGDINQKYGYFKNTPNNGVIDGFPIEVYVNESFYGIYTLNLNKEYMFEDGTNKDYTMISNQTDYGMRDIKKETSKWENFEVEVGKENQQTLDNFNRLLDFIHNSTDKEFKQNIEDYFNLDSLLNYYCYVKFAGLWDNVGRNLYFLTYDGKIWYTIFYDLDYSYGSHYSYNEASKKLNDFIAVFPLWIKLEKNFGNEIYNRYQELRKNILTKNYVVNKYETFYNKIPTEILNKDRSLWPGMEQYTSGKLRNYLNTRISVVDKEIAKLYKEVPQEEVEKPNTNEGNNSSNNSSSNNNNNNSSSNNTNDKESNSNDKKPNKEEPENNENPKVEENQKEENSPTEEQEKEENNNEEIDKEAEEEQLEEEKQPNKENNKEQKDSKTKFSNKTVYAIIAACTLIVLSIVFILRKKK